MPDLAGLFGFIYCVNNLALAWIRLKVITKLPTARHEVLLYMHQLESIRECNTTFTGKSTICENNQQWHGIHYLYRSSVKGRG